MSSSEFEQRLGAEPRKTVDAWRADPDADPRHAEAVTAAEGFENTLEGALRLPVDEARLQQDLLSLPANVHRRDPPRWLAMAASLVLAVGVAGIAWWSLRPTETDIAGYVTNHYRHDGAEVLSRETGGIDQARVASVLASLGAVASDDLSTQIRYIKFCPTPNSRGAHMVLATAAGPATVIFMPAVQVDEPMLIRFDGMSAEVVGLASGAAAIIGVEGDEARRLQTRLEEGLRPRGADA